MADLYTQTNLTTVGVSVKLLWNVLETVKDNKEPDELQRGRESYWCTADRQTTRHRDTPGAVRSLKLAQPHKWLRLASYGDKITVWRSSHRGEREKEKGKGAILFDPI